MLIDGKSRKQNKPDEAPRKKFDFFSREKMTRLPAHIGFVIVALALYLRALISPPTSRDAENGERTDQRNDPASQGLNDQKPSFEVQKFEHEEIDGRKAHSALQHYDTGADVDWSPPSDIAFPAEALRFTNPDFGHLGTGLLPVAFSFSISNDNALPARPSASRAKIGGPGVNPIPSTNPEPTKVSDPIQPEGSDPQEVDGDDDTDDEDIDQDDDADTDSDDHTNRAPSLAGPVRLNDVFAGQAMLIGLSQLLFGAHDPDGDPLAVTNLIVSNAIELANSQDGWMLQSRSGMLGGVTLSYEVTDGEYATHQTAHFEIVRNSVVLTPLSDLFVGTAYDDDINGGAGNDIVSAKAGNDLVLGGLGSDHIFGDEGDDVLYGDAGKDTIFGGAGNDIIYGGANDDRLFGDAGRDTLFGDDGDDWIEGGDGDDIAYGGEGGDTLLGGQGDDRLWGDSGNDSLSGGKGRDTLHGGQGNDILEGGSGDDILDGGSDNDSLDGGAGADILIGSLGADILLGQDGHDELDGGAGNDFLSGGSGNDRIAGGEGDDVEEGGNGNDVFVGGAGNDVYEGGNDHDSLDYSSSQNNLVVDDRVGEASGDGIGHDQYSGIEELHGGAGSDLFVIGASARIISGGRGQDMFVFDVTDERPTLSEDVVHDILDFVVGDRIRVRDYDISREARAAERDLFRSIYGDDDDDWLRSDIPIFVGHNSSDGIDMTVIRADLNKDDIFDVTINVHDVLLTWVNDPVSA